MSDLCHKGTMVLFAPHPDDETLGCGGFLAKRIDEGYAVFVVVLTKGEKLFSRMLDIFEDPSPSEVCEMRRSETRRATEIMGLPRENLLFLDFEDAMLEIQGEAAVKAVIEILQQKKPCEVMCTSEHEAHADHVAAYRIVRRACEKVGDGIAIRKYITLLAEGVSISQLPGRIETVDVRKYLPAKRKAVAQFRSHLEIQSARQSRPLAVSFEEFLTPEEQFVL